MATQWGRRETVIWPPHMPIYSYVAVTVACFAALFFLWENYTFQQPEIRKAYTIDYLRATFGAQFNQHGKYQLLMVGGPARQERLAVPADFNDEGKTLLPDGKSVPVMLSADTRAQGYTFFHRAPATRYSDASMYRWMRLAIFGGQSLAGVYGWALGETAFVLILALGLAVPRDIQRLKEIKYGRRLKGPVMLSTSDFNRTVRGDGIGITTTDRARGLPRPRRKLPNGVLRIPKANEAQHIEIIGDTGAGKSTLITQLLQQIKQRGESAIIYDPACEFVKRFYNPKTDIILNPLDARCPYWGPAEELRRKAEAKAIAASLYQPTSDKKGEFFTETPQKIFAHLLTFGPTPQQLVQWMSNPDDIDERVKGTELEQIIAHGAQQQRAGVLASLGLIADSLRMLPTKDQAKGHTWSATQWAEKRDGWIFITSQATEREALRPLHSLWIDLLVLRLLNAPTPEQRPVWFVLDELASLQRLPQLHTAITENRKSKNPLVLGFQGKAQLETIYGHLAEVMLSQPATKIFLKTTEPKAAEWVSKAIGSVEIERMRETHVHGTREGKSFAIDRQTEPLVMDSEIAGLPDKHAFLKLGNNVARFAFSYTDLPPIAESFTPRSVKDDELAFDPITLTPNPKPVPAAGQMETPHLPATAVLVADDREAAGIAQSAEASTGETRKARRKPRSKRKEVAAVAQKPLTASESEAAQPSATEVVSVDAPVPAPEGDVPEEPMPAAIVTAPPSSFGTAEHL